MSLESKVKNYKLACKAYDNNENIAMMLAEKGVGKSECIELAYELQAGSYTREFNKLSLKRNYELHGVINKIVSLPDVNSVAVFGVGDAKQNNFQENSVDVSMTMHSIEPNGNAQGAIILDNAIKSAAKYIILFEPNYSTAHQEMKDRMLKHDYVRNIEEHLSTMDSILIREKYIMEVQETTNNLTTCWVLEKKEKHDATYHLTCPISGCRLESHANFLYAPEAGLAYPKIGDVMCLNKDDAIFIGKAE